MSGYGGGSAGGARWNDETQSWETGGAGRAPVTPPVGAGGPVAPPPPSSPSPLPPPPPPTYVPGSPPPYLPEAGGWQHSAAPVPAGRPRSRAVLVAGAVAAVLAAGSFGAWLVWGGEDGSDGPAAGPGTSVSAPAEPDGPTAPSPSDLPPESPSDAPTATAGTPPEGYRVQEDLKGFTIAVPEGWDRTESDQGVFYNAPDGRSLLQVFVIEGAGMTPYEALRGTSEDGRTGKPGYREISLAPVADEPDAPADSAELVYAYDREGGRRQVVDRAFTAEDGNQYAILAAGPETDWPKQREVLRVALESFRPGAY
ncbi:serine/arginine repetitive matrix protein 2 [Streptomyces sp. NPDC058872]|uniref:serine/arginine repetitive matrix protein 2 n=1 Tax=Streptomyces sp. NPDC058872 TaxID=3346661 RepID=UPI003684C705